MTFKPLPILMVAPNGARKGKKDHRELPISIADTVAVAKECFDAGADGLHLHVRDDSGLHSLDATLYKEALKQLHDAAPSMTVQITTEAVGQYSPEQQRKVVRDVLPEHVSISLAEMQADNNRESAATFYQWCRQQNISVQHILYGIDDLKLLHSLLEHGQLINDDLQLLFVLGRYTENQQSKPEDLRLFTDWLSKNDVLADWALCAFGRNESVCLQAGLESGGKVRVGFENSIWNADGTIAKDNCERVVSTKALVDEFYHVR
ncbi:MAG: 3-keto-5-aminohexanoate cleavage protein [Granulosicoccus sp.]